MASATTLVFELMQLAESNLEAARTRLLTASAQQLMRLVLALSSNEAELKIAATIIVSLPPGQLQSMEKLSALIVPAWDAQIARAQVRLSEQEAKVKVAFDSALKAQKEGSYEAPGLAEYYYRQIAIREKRKGILDRFTRNSQRARAISTILNAETARRALV